MGEEYNNIFLRCHFQLFGGKCPEVEPQNHVVIFFLIFEEMSHLFFFFHSESTILQFHLEKFLGETLKQKQAKRVLPHREQAFFLGLHI